MALPPPPGPSAPQLGMTTSIPVEVAMAAGWRPVDLNNRFITQQNPAGLVLAAEEAGLPRTLCAWIKGMYSWCLAHPEVGAIVAVTQGDCSNTHALGELLTAAGRRVIPFEFPHRQDRAGMERALSELAQELGADLPRAESLRRALLPLREKLALLDRLTWQTGQVTGGENHLWLVSASDFNGSAPNFAGELDEFLALAQARPPRPAGPRLGFLGVPPIMDGLHQALEEMGARVVYNEVQRQFAMPPNPAVSDLASQYLAYTYPYDVFGRVAEIGARIKERGINGLVHYTQTFCYRQMQDVILRDRLPVPILTLEGDKTGPPDGRTLLRLEAFLELLA